MFQLDALVLGFEHLKSLYVEDEDLGDLYSACLKHPKGDFLIQEGYLFKGVRLCIPKCSTRELLIREVHGGSLACLLYTSPSPRDGLLSRMPSSA